MEEKAKFKIIYSKDADDFLNNLPTKIKDKIIYNIAKAKFVIDPELFKKLDDTDIWEFRTFYNKVKYRLYKINRNCFAIWKQKIIFAP